MPLVRIGGILKEVSEEEARNLQQKVEDQGIPAPPITPVGAGIVGADEDQAKMAGTKAQRTAATQIALEGPETLEAAERLRGARQAATGAEQQATQRVEQLRNLGSLNSRVEQLVQTMFAGQATAAGAGMAAPEELRFEVAEDVLTGLAPETQDAVRGQVEAIQTSAQAGDAATFNQSLIGLKSTLDASWQTADEATRAALAPLMDTVTQQISSAIGDEVRMGDVGLEEIGVTPEEMGQIFGPEWEQLSLTDFQQQFETLEREEFSRIEGLQRELQDINTSPARKGEILQELKDLGAVGITGAEAQMNELETAVEAAEELEFMGEMTTVEGILDDETITEWITRYLDNPTGSFAEQLTESAGPQFIEWINRNKEILTELSQEIKTSAESFDELQEVNQQARTIEGGGELSDQLMSALFDDFGEWTTRNYAEELQTMPWYQELTRPDVSEADREKLVAAINVSALADSTIVEELNDLDANESRKLMQNPSVFEDYAYYRLSYTDPDQLNSNDLGQLTSALFGYKVDNAADVLEEQYAASLFNAAAGDSVAQRFLDKYRDMDEDSNYKISANEIMQFLQENRPTAPARELGEFIDKPGKLRRPFDVAVRAHGSDVKQISQFLSDSQSPGKLDELEWRSITDRFPKIADQIMKNPSDWRSIIGTDAMGKVKDTLNSKTESALTSALANGMSSMDLNRLQTNLDTYTPRSDEPPPFDPEDRRQIEESIEGLKREIKIEPSKLVRDELKRHLNIAEDTATLMKRSEDQWAWWQQFRETPRVGEAQIKSEETETKQEAPTEFGDISRFL